MIIMNDGEKKKIEDASIDMMTKFKNTSIEIENMIPNELYQKIKNRL